MKERILDIQNVHLLQQTAQYFRDHQQQAYLVGGSLRNILLGEACVDWDIVTDGDVPTLARQLADKLGGHYVHMHDKASRVVVKHEKEETIFDISPLMGNSIEDDLRARDFTINAMAVALAGAWHPQAGYPQGVPLHFSTLPRPWQFALCTTCPQGVPLHFATPPADLAIIDPLHGIADIEARRLRAVDSDVFRHDPLRMLRAVRLMMRYQLSIDTETESLMIRDAALLPTVAPERIHDELYAILGPQGASERLRFLDAHGLLTVLIPEFIPARGMRQPSHHYWDVLEHSIEAVGALEQLAMVLDVGGAGAGGTRATTRVPSPLHPAPAPTDKLALEELAEIRSLLLEAEQQGVFQFAMLTAPAMKLAALLHDIGKPATYSTDEDGSIRFDGHEQAGVPLAQQVMRRLSASTQDRRLVQQVVAQHLRPWQLSQEGSVTLREIRRYFVDLGSTGIAVALFSLADHLATYGPQPLTSWERHLATVRLLLTCYIRERESILPPRLLSPEELMRRLKLEPGPLVGQLLEYIAEAQVEGQIHTKEEAFYLAEEKLRNDDPLLK